MLVDEGQDLSENDWLFIEHCAKRDGALWTFYDPAQAFWPDRAIPAELFSAHVRLPTVHRTPSALTTFARSFVHEGERDAALAAALETDQLVLVTAHDESSIAKRVEAQLDRLTAENVTPSDIAIISLRGLSEPNSVARLDKLGRHRLVRAEADDARENIIADTFLRTKGLERPFVIITDLRPEASGAGVRMYVALTRALVGARIVATSASLAAHGLERRARVDAPSA